tara:strand:- start:122 stop:1936 length:1815 start_codon:yes stop_codon:yes gene_type:complete
VLGSPGKNLFVQKSRNSSNSLARLLPTGLSACSWGFDQGLPALMHSALSTVKNELEETIRNGEDVVAADTLTEALRLLDETLKSQMQTKTLSLQQLKATIRGIAKMESFSRELINSRVEVNDLNRALSSIILTLRDALNADRDVDAVISTSEKVAVATSMVRELVAARDHALEQALSLSIGATRKNTKPQVTSSSSDLCVEVSAEPVRQTSAETDADADVKVGEGEHVRSISLLSLNELPTAADSILARASTTTSAHAISLENTAVIAKQQVPRVLDEIFTAVRESTLAIGQQKAHDFLQLVTRLDAARESAEHEARAARAEVATMRADVAVAWDALATPRATPTRGGVEQFADELEALLKEKDASAVEAAKAVEDRRRALVAVSRAEDDTRAHIHAREEITTELRTLQDESVGLRRHVRELADRNQKSRHQLANERFRCQQKEDENKTTAAREEKERRRAEALQSEIQELRSGLTRKMQEANRSATAVKNVRAELERERSVAQLLRAREEQLELKVCELADELARQDKMLAKSPNSSDKIVTGFSSSALHAPSGLRELEILVQELAKEELRARRRAEEAERTVDELKADVEQLNKKITSGVNS